MDSVATFCASAHSEGTRPYILHSQAVFYFPIYFGILFMMLIQPKSFRSINRLVTQPSRKYMSHFRVIEHTARCQNVRQRPGAVKAGHESELRLAVKQYIPIDNPHPKEGDVTIIGAHANAFPKVTQLHSTLRTICTEPCIGALRAPLG